MVGLLIKDIRTINLNIMNKLEEGELAMESTILKFRIVQKEAIEM